MTFFQSLKSFVTYFAVVAVVVFVDVFYVSFFCVFDVYVFFSSVFFSVFSDVVYEIVSSLHLGENYFHRCFIMTANSEVNTGNT